MSFCKSIVCFRLLKLFLDLYIYSSGTLNIYESILAGLLGSGLLAMWYFFLRLSYAIKSCDLSFISQLLSSSVINWLDGTFCNGFLRIGFLISSLELGDKIVFEILRETEDLRVELSLGDIIEFLLGLYKLGVSLLLSGGRIRAC